MFDREITLNRFLLDYFDALVRDLPESGLETQAANVGHSALWLLGHLAISVDFGLSPFQHERVCPRRWFLAFSPGSSDVIENPEKFDPAAMIETIRTGYPLVQQAAANADPDLMAQPHTVEILKGSKLTTQADIVAHILTTHFAMHLGQLSFWRRLQGAKPLF